MNTYYKKRDVARIINIHEQTLMGWVKRGLIPQPERLGFRRDWIWSPIEVAKIIQIARRMDYQIPKHQVENEVWVESQF